MPSTPKIRIIHALKRALWMDDSTYRAMLESYGTTTSKDLTDRQASHLIDALKARAKQAGVWKPRHRRTQVDLITEFQRRKIECMWAAVSRAPDEKRAEALNTFLAKRFGISRLEWLTHKDVAKVIRTLKAMIKEK